MRMTEKSLLNPYRIVATDRDGHISLRRAVERVWSGVASPDDFAVAMHPSALQPGTHLSCRAFDVLDLQPRN